MLTSLGFYSARLKKEKGIRRLSFVFIAMTMVLQVVVVASPPQRSLAASPNHIIDGIRTRDDILRAWDRPGSDVAAIYQTFGLTRDDIARLPQQPNDRIYSKKGQNRDIWTIGRSSIRGRADIPDVYRNSQLSVRYAGEGTSTTRDDQYVYMRNLQSWNNRGNNDYLAFKGTMSNGKTFWILTDCGNFTQFGRWSPPPPPPPPTPTIDAVCSIAGPAIIPRGSNTVRIPVRIGLPKNSSIPKGTPDNGTGNSRGLHLGVTTVGSPSTWKNHPANSPTITPPDKQSDYIPVRDDNSGVTQYSFNFSDGFNYKRYYVNNAQDSSFDVVINVKVNENDKRLAVRLLDREKAEWLPHFSACEIPITREKAPTEEPEEEPTQEPEEVPEEEPEPPTPNVVIRKSIKGAPTSLEQGDTFTYDIEYRNTKVNSLAEDVVITDEFDTRYFSVVRPSNLDINNGRLSYDIGGLSYTPDFRVLSVTVRLKDQLPSKTEVCNVAKIVTSNGNNDTSDNACVTVINKCPIDVAINLENDDCARPQLSCKVLTANINRTTRKVTFNTTVDSSNAQYTQIKKYTYDYGDDVQEDFASNKLTHSTMHTYAPGDYEAMVTVMYRTTNQEEAADQSIDCMVPIDFEEDQPVSNSKTVKNITQDIEGDAVTDQGSKVFAGDVLEYTLTTNNTQGYDRVGIDVSDYIGDLLDYAVIDTAFIEEQGGVYDRETNKITWSDVSIPANGSVTHQIRVTLKDPIPSTNAPSSVSASYDCRISNNYGNEITIDVDCPAVKGLETLPNTGPGASLAAMTGVTVVIGYFFSRSRLLSKEINYVRQDYVATGGM